VCVTDRDGGEDCYRFTITTPPPPPTLAVSGDTVSEGGGDLPSGSLTFSIHLSEPTARDVFVQVQTADGTATASVGYAPVDTAVTIPAGEHDVTVVVQVVGDLLKEPDESVRLILSAATGAVLDPVASSPIGTIVNDDVCDIVSTGGQPIVGTPEDEVTCGTDGDDVIDGGGGNTRS
jgi:hypothetical protein